MASLTDKFQVKVTFDANKVAPEGLKDFACLTLTYDDLSLEDLVMLEGKLESWLGELFELGRVKLAQAQA